MYSNYTNINDGSTFSVNKSDTKKTPTEELITASPFEQLFTMQRDYIQSDEVRAIQDINLKKQSYISVTEIDMLTAKPSREQLHSTNTNGVFQSFDNQISTQRQTTENNHNKNFFETRKDKSITKNGDDHANFSFDIENPSINSSPLPTNRKSNVQRSPQKEHTTKGGLVKEKRQMQNSICESNQDFLKAIQGVGNIFRFYGIIQPKMKRFFYTKTMLGRMRHLTNAVRHTINDLVDFQHKETTKQCFKNFLYNLYYILERICLFLRLDKIPIFNPENKLKIIFNCIIVTYNCFYLLLRSLQIFFHADYGVYGHHFHTIAEVAWVLEMVIQMNTSMYHHNHFTKDRKVIMKIYLKEYFLFEVLPLIFDGRKSDYLLFNVLFLLPLLLKIKEFYILQILDNHSVFFLLKLIMQMMLFGHILACSFSLVSAYEVNFFDYVTPWQTRFEEHYTDWETKYLQSLYWAFTTMMNVQNMQPTSNLELAFTCTCMLVSCVAFGYLISAIGGILNEINKEQKEYKKDLNILNQFMKRKKIEIGLIRRANIQLKKYYEQQRRVRYIQENETLMKLNEYMMKELLISSNFKIIKRYPFFLSLFTDQTLFKMCTKMQEKLYAPSQIIFDKSIQQQDDYNLYLIVSGQITIEDQFNLQVNSEKKEHNKYYFLDENNANYDQIDEEDEREHEDQYVGRKLHKGDFFGVRGFFTGRESMQKAISQDFSTVMIISKKDMENILSEEKRDFEKYKEVADKIIFSNDFSDLKAQCHSCLSRFHYTDQCTKVYLDKDPLFVIQGQNYSINQERGNILRKRKKFNAIPELFRITEIAFTIKYDLNLECDSDVYSNYTQTDQESFDENEDVVEGLRDQQKQKGQIHRDESKMIEPAFDEREQYRTEIIKPDSKFESQPTHSLEINVQSNFGQSQHSEDEGIYYEMKQQSTRAGLIEREQIHSSIDHEPTKERISHQSSLPQSFVRGSIDGSLFQNSRMNTLGVGQKQDHQLKQLLSSLQEVLTQINPKSNNKGRKQSIQMGSTLEIASKLANPIIRIPSTIDKFDRSQKTTQFEEYAHSSSRRSNIRQPHRSASFVNSKKEKQVPYTDQYKEMSIKEKVHSTMVNIENIFIWELDRLQNYESYFSEQNAPEIIKRYNAVQVKLGKKRKSKKAKNNSHPLKRTTTQNTRKEMKSFRVLHV